MAALVQGTDRSVDPAEVAKWWDPEGTFKALHRLNPVRLGYIRDRAAGHFGREALEPKPLAGLKLLEIGCGGGLLSAPLCRLGAQVTGIDAGAENIAVAKHYAAGQGLAIDYRCTTAEALAAAGEAYDLVVTMEVVEHVADVPGFLAACCDLVRPGGALAAATLNRTPKSFLMAIVGAEYLLRWLPPGTHDWQRFLRPSELVGGLQGNGLRVQELAGVGYNPLTDSWRLTRDTDVNYMLFAIKE